MLVLLRVKKVYIIPVGLLENQALDRNTDVHDTCNTFWS